MRNLAPIVLFVYNRPYHTKQTVEALQKNEFANESELFIYSDEAKNLSAKESVDEVRNYIKTIDGFKKVTIVEREKNFGLANSIIDGVTKIVNEYGKIIVLEDDLVTSLYFLQFMNEALEFYKNKQQVYSITGYSFTDEADLIESTYFLSVTSSWSWATWADKWRHFKRDSENLEKYIKDKSNHYKFNFYGSYDYISMSKSQLKKEIDSWAIYWYFCVLQRGGLTLYPAKSLVQNIGFDGSGVHCSSSNTEKPLTSYRPILTNEIFEKESVSNIVKNIFKKESKISLFLKVKNRVNKFAKKVLSNEQKIFLSLVVSKLKLLFYKKKIGKNTYIDKTVNVIGWGYISIGSNTLIGEQSWLNVNKRVENFEHIKIGNYCYIGRRNLLSSSKELIISDYVMVSNDCKFLGNNHVYSNPLSPYIATGTTDEDVLKIGVNVWIGAGTIVLGAVTVGHGSIVGAGSVVTKDIPPFSIAVGNSSKVIKRYNFKLNKWEKVSDFDQKLETLMPSEEEYLAILKTNKPHINMPIMAATSRFGDLF
ncbi:MAG: acyltransferase [Sulfurimonas sp.]|jgi:acetyltransferase-like isoleucine patch superfamily enzyme|uniref:acyltransferase n=1 Tax=Sulfurimonas sp. TaxID=2022749 RepID=UPI001BC4131F|nr:acyltransferase [Sulfurimonas sp.]MBS4067765.1 glycosyltransferase [Sulfurimonas sp.]MDD3854347.1 acyltransferase [Sulfurimonas sp.]